MLPDFFELKLPTHMLYSEGIVSRLGSTPEIKALGKKKALVLTDKIIAKVGLLDKLKTGLQESEIEITAVYDNIPPNSELTTVEEATALGRENNIDLIIALGGGSVLDTAKVVNVMVLKGGKVEDHMGAKLIDGRILPAIFIPTTAGTGSEITQFAMISDTKNDMKMPFAEDAFLPDIAVLDPEMTETMPGKVTAATGMDALTHAIEAYVAKESNPMTDALALKAIELIGQNMLQAAAVPDDLSARGGMLVASFMAAIAFNTAGVGIVHGISHALGGIYHVPHGLANSIILPFSIDYNMETSAERYARISEVLGSINIHPAAEISKMVAPLNNDLINNAVDQLSIVDEWLTRRKALTLKHKLQVMNQQLAFLTGHATNLVDAGVKDGFKRIEEVVSLAMEDGALLYNPTDVTTDGVRAILREAYDQNLPPIKVTRSDFKAARRGVIKPRLKGIFKDSDELYEILGGFYREMTVDKELVRDLLDSGLKVRFVYNDPEGAVTIDASGSEVGVYFADEAKEREVDVEMSLAADLAHYFWHGQLNAIQALSRREITPRGNLPKALKLLPLLGPAYELYPKYLREKGHQKIVLT